MEQDVKENEVLLLRFKYHSFFDLNPKVRSTEKAAQVHFKASWEHVENIMFKTAIQMKKRERDLIFFILVVHSCFI